MSKISIPKGSYIKKLEINDNDLDIEFSPKQKVALLFICLNDRYWPYIAQVINDCRKNFLPHHNVDYFVWTDFNDETKKKQIDFIDQIVKKWTSEDNKQPHFDALLNAFAFIVRLYEVFYVDEVKEALQLLEKSGIVFKREQFKFWIEANHPINEQDVILIAKLIKDLLLINQNTIDKTLENCVISETDSIEWPAPTLMRYHLFLNQEEKLKEYDYIYYMDADMRVVSKISDEILGEGLTSAEHPMYSLRKEYIPPYEPNSESTAYIHRPGQVVDDNGSKRFKPFYYAGGFQGGKSKEFIKAMHTMKKNIDKDFDNNYTAIWNDESHWNKYLSDYKGHLIVLSPSYVYPDSLIKEYYEKIWGCSYEPKIVTLTKPFSLSPQGAEDINKFIKS